MAGSTQATAGKSSGGGGAATRPCKEKEACGWLEKFVSTTPPTAPSDIPKPQNPSNFWLDEQYRTYCDLYRAVRNLEMSFKHGQPWNQQDALSNKPGPNPNPTPDKAGCPPPPGFP